MNVTVIGIGAMGGGMARALLRSDVAKTVVGYDKNEKAVESFFSESVAANKSLGYASRSLKSAISPDTNIVVISLVNEGQCEQVCFGSNDENLLQLLPKGSCVVLTSTVTATWAQKADQLFRKAGIHFVDCPVSGGPARSLEGDLTLIASGEEECLDFSQPVLDALAREVHVIKGGAGGGSTVKCIHQLLAGVHICAAAEAMAMAAKAGVDVAQLYEIVNGAAGASWMFTDRGKRMLEQDPDVKSALAIFVKDLDIVYAEAKRLMSPIPVASAALQQFISGQSLGLGGSDDSQVVKVYEKVTGVEVVGAAVSKGSVVVDNQYVKVHKSSCASDTSFEAISQQSVAMKLDRLHLQVEILKSTSLSTSRDTMSTDLHELIWDDNSSSNIRVYKLTLPSAMSTTLCYPFFHLVVAMTQCPLSISMAGPSWKEDIQAETIKWSQPIMNYTVANEGSNEFIQYVVEFL